jgi:hypothetical protein
MISVTNESCKPNRGRASERARERGKERLREIVHLLPGEPGQVCGDELRNAHLGEVGANQH